MPLCVSDGSCPSCLRHVRQCPDDEAAADAPAADAPAADGPAAGVPAAGVPAGGAMLLQKPRSPTSTASWFDSGCKVQGSQQHTYYITQVIVLSKSCIWKMLPRKMLPRKITVQCVTFFCDGYHLTVAFLPSKPPAQSDRSGGRPAATCATALIVLPRRSTSAVWSWWAAGARFTLPARTCTLEHGHTRSYSVMTSAALLGCTRRAGLTIKQL